MNAQVDKYLIDGCMRCNLGATPACKVNNWRDELVALRHIALKSGLTEELKWGVPCYTLGGKNVAIVSALKEFACLSFFKGSLMADPQGILLKQGEHSQIARILKFTSLAQIVAQEDVLLAYLKEAMAIEARGEQVVRQQNPEPMPEELLQKFEENPALRQAFMALTPGRQRGYIIYFSQPKQSKSRIGRIEKYAEKIMRGEGMQDRD